MGLLVFHRGAAGEVAGRGSSGMRLDYRARELSVADVVVLLGFAEIAVKF